MWYLTCDNDSRVIYVLPFKQITIGRSVDGQMCNFAIPDDASISRKHATLDNGGNHLILQDLGSRYGTFVNNSADKVSSNTPIQLKEKDVVKLGKLNSIWVVNKADFVTCTSTLKGESLQNLKSCLNKLGGILKNEWDDSCMYLTMPAITLTIKVVLALVQGSYIVTPEFWSHCMAAVDTNQPLPDQKNYTPNIVESTLNKDIVSFNPNAHRQSLFNGKKIVFFSKRQFEMYKSVITKSSGTPLLLSESKMTKSMLCEEDVIVIQCNVTNLETQVTANQVNEIINYLKTHYKRVVADAEIGLAILYCNIDKYCNPNFNFSSEVMKQQGTNKDKSSGNVLVQESQENQLQSQKENVIINESLASENMDGNASSTNIFKRKHSDDATENAQKKLATGKVSTLNTRINKRKNSEDLNVDENPSKKRTEATNDDDIFNFINSSSNNDNQDKGLGKKLNLSKPQKRKQDSGVGNEEDDIFNFVQDKTKSNEDSTKKNIFNVMMKKSRLDINDDIAEEPPKIIKKEVDEQIDISALRGRKLNELMKNNLEINGNVIHKIKKEQDDDLDNRMNKLDLGTTIVTIKNDLIVKKEPVMIDSERNTSGRNFKKFKKIWPLKMQVTVISTAAKSHDKEVSGRDETCSQVY